MCQSLIWKKSTVSIHSSNFLVIGSNTYREKLSLPIAKIGFMVVIIVDSMNY